MATKKSAKSLPKVAKKRITKDLKPSTTQSRKVRGGRGLIDPCEPDDPLIP